MWAIPAILGLLFLSISIFYKKKHHGELASESIGGDSIIVEIIFIAFLLVLDILPYWVTKFICLAVALGFFYLSYQIL
ncbi:hypothetical protein AM500_04235 [Bacillus sp. FJAT-18017]|uniref:hypothetical protein n=1 Tax=Bacillus sp. FJAT-18017 TaxID=1705566 RepID=UPI0006AE37DF|nr:hypothetical protein [Bacillus sp. FJAT-18017]ALC89089.1 hypothetical protein AM500_04235 [Bacillus sp. FJAT-18017]